MARITRQTQKIFALGATNNGQFGSAKTGAKVTTNSLPTLMSLSAYNTGWLNAVIGTKNFPALEEFQALSYIETYQICYLLQEGIAEYDSGTTYYQNSIVKKAGTYQIYGSVVDNNTGNVLTDVTRWVFLTDFAATPLASSYLNASSDTGSADHYVLAPNPAPGAYAEGQVVILNAAHDNTGACDIYLNSLAVKSIKMPDGTTDPAVGYIHATNPAVLVYHGGVFILTNPYYQFGTAAFLNAGTGANQVVQRDVSGNYPSGNGSAITGIYSATNSASGKLVFGPITLQWGSQAITSGSFGGNSITFPVAFSGTPYHVNAMLNVGSASANYTTGGGGVPNTSSVTASGFLYQPPTELTATVKNVQWFAIGPT